MKNKTLIKFVESFVFFPIAIVGVPLGSLTQAGYHVVSNSQTVLSQKYNIEASGLLAINNSVDQELEAQKAKEAKAKAIDAYFEDRGMPLKGMGMKMVEEAEKNKLDWRLLPAIAVRESTGGKFECKRVPNNAFGWGSCRIGFQSNEEAIETVARNLGGHNPRTRSYYANKNVKQMLQAYNPPSIVPRYAEQVMSIMNSIGEEDTIAVIKS